MTPHVTVIGGGISGLAAAFELHRRGTPFLLLESSDRLGGIIRTDCISVPALGELVIDAGPDAMLARKRAGIALCEDLGIAGRLVPASLPRAAFIVRNGALQPIPPLLEPQSPAPGPGDESPAATPGDKSPAATHGDESPAATHGDESLAAYFARRYGPDAVAWYAEPLLAGIHAGDVDRLSVRALFPELLEEASPRAIDPQGLFRSFPRGMQELVDALVAALPAEHVRTGAPATSVAEHLASGPVILAIPAAAAVDVCSGIDSELATLCRGIRSVSSGIVVLAYPRRAVRHPLAGSGFVVPRVEHGTRILAATWLSSKWPGRAPAGVALLRAFFGGDRDPEAIHLPDDRLVAMAHGDLARLLHIDGAPAWSRVYRWIDGTPQYEVGYLARLAAIRVAASRHRALFLAGAAFGSIGIPGCIESGRAAAERAAATLARGVQG